MYHYPIHVHMNFFVEGCNPACVHGKCVDGKCQCDQGYTGKACDQKSKRQEQIPYRRLDSYTVL